MGGLFGPLGGLDELPCASTLKESPTGDDVMQEVAAEDGTVYVQLAPELSNRVWEVEAGTLTPGQAAILGRIRAAQYTRSRPSVFYSEAAQVENLLDPEASTMSVHRWEGLTRGGAGILPDDYLPAPRYLTSGYTPLNGGWASLSRIPIPMNRVVTVACVLTAFAGRTARFRVREVGVDGRVIREETHTRTGVRERVTTTFTTTGQTASLTLSAADAATVVDPQVTLTRSPVEWAYGAGCMNAVLMRQSRDVQLAIPDVSWGRRSAHAWTIREVGHASMGHMG